MEISCVIKIAMPSDSYLLTNHETAIPHMSTRTSLMQEDTEHTQLHTETETNATEQASNNANVSIFEIMEKGNCNMFITQKYCPLKHERLKYQKRESKRKNKRMRTYFSCSREYYALKNELKTPGLGNVERKAVFEKAKIAFPERVSEQHVAPKSDN